MTDLQRGAKRGIRAILVTGAGGFVGSNIVETLLEAGQRVIAVDRAFDPERVSRWQSMNTARAFDFIESDAENLPALEIAFLVHAAAITAGPDDSDQSPEQNFRANIEPMLSMMEWAQRNGVRRSLFISSSALYIGGPAGPIDETTPAHPHGLYSVAKQTMEALVETLRTQYERDFAVMRLSNIYGPYEQPRPTRPRISLVGSMLHDALTTGVIHAPDTTSARDWTFAPDIARAATGLMLSPYLKHAVYNVASGQVYTPLDIARAIQQQLPHVVIEQREPTHMEAQARGYLTNSRLKQDAGFGSWTTLDDGLKQTIAAYKPERVQ